jgi:hypothetical protein
MLDGTFSAGASFNGGSFNSNSFSATIGPPKNFTGENFMPQNNLDTFSLQR